MDLYFRTDTFSAISSPSDMQEPINLKSVRGVSETVNARFYDVSAKALVDPFPGEISTLTVLGDGAALLAAFGDGDLYFDGDEIYVSDAGSGNYRWELTNAATNATFTNASGTAGAATALATLLGGTADGDTVTLDLGSTFTGTGNAEIEFIDATLSALLQARTASGETVLISDSTFEKTGTGATAVYSFNPSLDNSELNAALGVGGDELPYLDLLEQIQFTQLGVVTKTRSFALRIENDIARSADPGTTSIDTQASQAEAEAGVNNAKWMSPLRTKQAIENGEHTLTQRLRSGAVDPGNGIGITNVRFLATEDIEEHAHYAFMDASMIEYPAVGANGHASFACYANLIGTEDGDHHYAFQDRTLKDGSGTIDKMATVYSCPIMGAGTVNAFRNFAAMSPDAGGTIGTHYYFYAQAATNRADTTYAFYSDGAAPSRFGGDVTSLGTLAGGAINASRTQADGRPTMQAFYTDGTGRWAWGMDVVGTTGDEFFYLGYYNGSTWQNAAMTIDPATPTKVKFDKINLSGIPTYANDSAASSLTAGDVYKTSTGELRIKL